jgi:hypothetical protein
VNVSQLNLRSEKFDDHDDDDNNNNNNNNKRSGRRKITMKPNNTNRVILANKPNAN